MKDNNYKLVLDEEGEFVLKLSWEEQEGDFPYWVNFQGMECISQGFPGEKLEFYSYDLGRGMDNQHKLEDFDIYYSDDNRLLHGHIKWDGCMEIHNFSHHWCGYNDFAQRIVKMIYQNAKEIMQDRFDEDLANFK